MGVIPPKDAREAIERAGAFCEHCGMVRPGGLYSLHHRRSRRVADHRAVNLMVVIPTHHNVAPMSIHQEPALSKWLGHIVLPEDDPEHICVRLLTPILLAQWRVLLLDPAYDLSSVRPLTT